jgi:hypothetical protein
MIRFRCPHCQKPLGVKDHLAGKRAKCPTCQKPILIPSASAKSTPTKPAAAAPELPSVEVEELAAAALSEQPETNGQTEAAATIDFQCEFCETTIHAPRADAGKRMQCPNPECRTIVKVPTPKEEKPKDWRDMAKKGPTVAQMMQPEKIDEAAWGTQTDKTRAGSQALKEAGALPEAAKEPVGVRGWIRRVMWTVGVAAAVVVLVVVASRIRTTRQEKDFTKEMLAYVQGKGETPIKDPVVRAEAYRGIAEYKIRYGKHYDALPFLQQALANVRPLPGAKGPSVDNDLLLIQLALTATELGGTEDDEIAKEKWNWKGDTLPKLLQSTLEAIKAPEAKAMALRLLTTRLLEKEQSELAIGVASQLSNPEAGRRPPATAQLVVLLLLKDKTQDAEKYVKAPVKDVPPEPLARIAYTEFYVRKGSYAEAAELAMVKGPLPEQIAACVGAAQALLSLGKKAEAAAFADKALELVNGVPATQQKKLPPWLLLQVIRAGAQVRGRDAVDKLPKLLPADFVPRAYLEVLQAELDAATAALDSARLADLKEANADSPAYDLGWEALARQNARVGSSAAIDRESRETGNERFRPMVYLGVTLGDLDRRR